MNKPRTKTLRRIGSLCGAAGALALLAGVESGCSSINASKSVAPIDFLMPGLHIQNGPASPALPNGTNTAATLAQAGSAFPADSQLSTLLP